MFVCTCIVYCVFSKIVEIGICFGESSMQVTEHQGLLMILLNLTNPSSTDIIITAITANGIAIGEVNSCTYIRMLCFNVVIL